MSRYNEAERALMLAIGFCVAIGGVSLGLGFGLILLCGASLGLAIGVGRIRAYW